IRAYSIHPRDRRHAPLSRAIRTTWRRLRHRRWGMTTPADMRNVPATSAFLARPLGLAGVLVLEAYFVVLGLATAFVLWRIWPAGDHTDPAVMIGRHVVVSTDPDARLILIAALSALLGSFVHSATSFATYLGNHKLLRAWVGWYVLRPVIGMALGLVFYFLLRAGLVTTESAAAVNEFGVAAVSALAGMFSKQAADKLEEVFDGVLASHKDAARADKLR